MNIFSMACKPHVIGLLKRFDTPNPGDEGKVSAVLQYVRQRWPDATTFGRLRSNGHEIQAYVADRGRLCRDGLAKQFDQLISTLSPSMIQAAGGAA